VKQSVITDGKHLDLIDYPEFGSGCQSQSLTNSSSQENRDDDVTSTPPPPHSTPS
ncbi:hypothetical protein A2U01_0068362, partial [Trifolium medium]|nr:hypothetical protein [Trifolium medium]